MLENEKTHNVVDLRFTTGTTASERPQDPFFDNPEAIATPI
jgi:hypothetical protein